MKTLVESNEKQEPTVRLNPSLDRYDEVVLFPGKLATANARLAKSGPPALPSVRPRTPRT